MAQMGIHVDLLRCRQLPSEVPLLEQAVYYRGQYIIILVFPCSSDAIAT